MNISRAGTSPLTADEFDARFERSRPRMLAVARAILGADGAEDIVQDTYVTARSRIEQLRDAGALDRWLARIAENLCYQALRRSKAHAGTVTDTIGDAPASDPALRDLLERLPLRERAIVVLHYGHGYSLEEIAGILRISYANCRALISRTRRRLYHEWIGSDR